MTIQIYYFNDIDIQKVKVFKKVYKNKQTNLYNLDVHLNNQELFFQTPQFVVSNVNSDNLEVNCNNQNFKNYINTLEDHICELLHKYSNDIFNGKKFTLEKIKKGLIRSFRETESKSEKVFVVKTTEHTKYFNQFKNEITKNQITNHSDIILLLRFKGLSFKGSSFKCDFVLEQAKVYCEEKLKDYSLIDDMDNQTYVEISEELDDEYYESETETETESEKENETEKRISENELGFFE
jgi:hypothetical protein